MLRYTTYLIDLDGVIYRGNELLPGAKEFIAWLKANNKKFLFLTNNSFASETQVLEKLIGLGIVTDTSHLLSAGEAAVQNIARRFPGARTTLHRMRSGPPVGEPRSPIRLARVVPNRPPYAGRRSLPELLADDARGGAEEHRQRPDGRGEQAEHDPGHQVAGQASQDVPVPDGDGAGAVPVLRLHRTSFPADWRLLDRRCVRAGPPYAGARSASSGRGRELAAGGLGPWSDVVARRSTEARVQGTVSNPRS